MSRLNADVQKVIEVYIATGQISVDSYSIIQNAVANDPFGSVLAAASAINNAVSIGKVIPGIAPVLGVLSFANELDSGSSLDKLTAGLGVVGAIPGPHQIPLGLTALGLGIYGMVTGEDEQISPFLNEAIDQFNDAIGQLGDLADTMNSNPDLNLTPSLPPWWNNLRDRFNDATDTPDPILTLRRLGAWGGDPLILDLNGDGVDLVQLADSTARFDLNANDFVTPTGWVNANDGLLVLDKNSNGRIDNVNELFGNDTMTGFDELALFDSNSDGKINAEDDVFNSLQVWQDSNQDGISQASELTSLNERQITTINLENTAYSDDNASRITATGSYETADGEVHTIVDSIFEMNSTNSQYVGEYELNVDALSLPWMRGAGQVAQLQIAMSKDESLLVMVQNLSQKDSLLSAREAFDEMLFKWAGVEESSATELNDLYSAVFQQQLFYNSSIEGDRGRPIWVMDANSWVSQVRINGNQIQLSGGNALDSQQVFAINKFLGLEVPMLKGEVANSIWNSLSNNLFARFIAQTELAPDNIPLDYNYFTDELGLETTSSSDLMAQVETLLESGESGSISEALFIAGLIDSSDLYVEFKLGEFEASASPELLSNMQSNAFYSTITRQSNITQGTSGNDELSGSRAGDTITGNAGDDVIESAAGNDVIYGGTGDDILNGGDGNDTYHFSRGDGNDTIDDYDTSWRNTDINKIYLHGITADEISYTTDATKQLTIHLGDNDSIKINNWFINGQYQIDQLVFEDGSVITNAQVSEQAVSEGTINDDVIEGSIRNDSITGGLGNDQLNGGLGSDSYFFNKGDGQDTIVESQLLTAENDLDKVVFGEGIAMEDVWFSKNNNDLTIDLLGSQDNITVSDWFAEEGKTIELLTLENGSEINASSVNALVDAMASFAVPEQGEVTLSDDERAQANQVIASNWSISA